MGEDEGDSSVAATYKLRAGKTYSLDMGMSDHLRSQWTMRTGNNVPAGGEEESQCGQM